MLLIFACGAGIYIGLYFNILALLPFIILGSSAFTPHRGHQDKIRSKARWH